MFCKECGRELPGYAKFCISCGTKVFVEEKKEKREEVYEGKVFKCPNCGQVLESLTTNCPTCGFEIRGKTAPNSVKELANKLQEIDNREYKEEKDQSLLKSLVGLDLSFVQSGKREERISAFKHDQYMDKERLILNFPVPNSKEDIIEFMIMANTNIESNEHIDAWKAKLKQVYNKAKVIITDDAGTKTINDLYNKHLEIEKEKKSKERREWILPICIMLGSPLLLMFMSLYESNKGMFVLVLALLLIVAVIIVYMVFKNKKK